MKKAQVSAGNVAVLIFLIAIFMALFILLLPAQDRSDLLNKDLDDENGDDSDSEVFILTQSPGLLKPSSDDETTHKIDSTNLFLRSESIMISNSFWPRLGNLKPGYIYSKTFSISNLPFSSYCR